LSGAGGPNAEPPYLYLTTVGWRSGRRHEIEIWYAALDGRYYLISELGDRAHWVRNLQHDRAVQIRLGNQRLAGQARVVDPAREPALAARVRALFEARYSWSDGLLVELTPARVGPGG
jgi:deazaflavin-dependent oxidoreductase (nitroreductase family)